MRPESADSGAAAGNTETSALVGVSLNVCEDLGESHRKYNGNVKKIEKKKQANLLRDDQFELVTVLSPTLFSRWLIQ